MSFRQEVGAIDLNRLRAVRMNRPYQSPHKMSKKCLATPAGIVTRGVIPRALEGQMRKFKTRRPFRLLFVLAGALMLLAAFTPRAKADLIAYFNFEGPTIPPYPVNLQSQVPPGFLLTAMTTNYNPANMSAQPGVALNVPPGDPDPNAIGLGLSRSLLNSPANFNIPLFTAQGLFQNMSISFAINVAGNGFTTVALWYSTNGGGTFTRRQAKSSTGGFRHVVKFQCPICRQQPADARIAAEIHRGKMNGQ